MASWLDAIPNLGVPGVPGVQPQKTATFSEHLTGTPGTPSGTPALNSNILKLLEEHREHLEHRKNDGLQDWLRSFTRLDPCQPHEGFTMSRWQQLYDDAEWILETHGSHAYQNGWTAADLFGLWPDKPHWGGIADRMCGARSLAMDADRASWRSWGQVERFNRGSYPHLRPFWEVRQ